MENKLNTYLTEYQALRAEIDWLIRDGTQYQKFSIAILSIIFAGIGWIIQNAIELLIPILLTIPFIFCVLGYLFLRQHEEVYVVASYIKEYIRPRVRKIIDDEDAWGWEEYKSELNERICSHRLFGCFSSSRMIVILRSCIFVVPSILSLAILVLYSIEKSIPTLTGMYGFPMLILFAIFYIFDILIFLLFLAYLMTQSDLPKRVGICNE